MSSSGFVFGENLADRVVQRSISEELAEDGSASPDSTEITNAGRSCFSFEIELHCCQQGLFLL